MILFLSDLHLGRGTRADSLAAERDAVALLRAHEDRVVRDGALVLAGDVFHEYIEYRHLVPKGGARLTGLLADWADRGAEVHYVTGNRDPWHLDYFAREIGLRVSARCTLDAFGRRIAVAHGDAEAEPGRRSAVGRAVARAPWAARLYRNALPGDGGFAVARWASRTFGTDGVPVPAVASALRAAAHRQLAETDADVVVYGHSHTEALETTPDGTYINPGYWFGSRTWARLTADGPALLRWTDGAARPVSPEPVALPPSR